MWSCQLGNTPLHAFCLALTAILVATLATADPSLHHREELLIGDKRDDTVTQLIKSMKLCFLRNDMQQPPPSFRWGWGRLYVRELCCSGTTINGLGVKMQPEWLAEHGESRYDGWQGDATLSLRLQEMKTTCQAHWDWVPDHWVPTPLGTNHSGNVTLKLETGADVAPFVDMNFRIAGKPLISGGIKYPFPGQASVLGCSTDFSIAQISFDGWAAEILNLTSYVTPSLLNVLQPLVCQWVRLKVPTVVTDALHKVHIAAAKLIDQIPTPLNVPTAPFGAGPAMNLQHSKQLDFVKGLLEQGLTTGELGRLINRATAGTGAAELKLGNEGVQLAKIGIENPTALDLKLFAEAGGVQGLHTIDHVGLQVSNTSSLHAGLTQGAATASVFFRTESAIPEAVGLTQRKENRLLSREVRAEQTIDYLMWRVLETLTERFSMRLSLSQLDASMELGLLVDEEKLHYLAEGQSWYDGDCLTSMVQNISVLNVNVSVVTENFNWTSGIKDPVALEVEFDAGVNSVLDYLNVPDMRPTISRLVKSLAAGQVRDAMNKLLAAWLAAPPEQPCTPKFGVGSHLVYSILAWVGGIAVLAAALCLAWWQSSHRPLNPERVAFLLAIASLCLLGGGLLGYPFRAAVRLHNGDAADSLAGDSIVNMFVLDLRDPLGPMPGAVAITAMQCLLAAARLVLLMAAVKLSFRRHLASGVRVLAAIGGWDLGVIYVFVGTQVASFYALIVKFGSSFADMGVQINPGFYLHALGIYLCDAATLLVYRRCLDPKLEGTVNVSCQMLMHKRHVALLGLVLALILLLVAPWLTLWTHSYGGVLGTAFHFQSSTPERALTLAAIFAQQGEVLNPGPAGLGIFALRLFLLVHVILAPIAHAVLALCVGLKLRAWSPGAREMPCQANASTHSTFMSFLSSGQPVAQQPVPPVWTQQLLVLMRMWAGADAFAITMWVVVPELGSQLAMMSAQGCDPLAPLLDRLGRHCNVITTDLAAPGLPVLFLGGLLVRISAEVYAHGPLRRLQQASRGQWTQTASLQSRQDVQLCGQNAGPSA